MATAELQSSLQKFAVFARSLKGDEEKIAEWKEQPWPQLKARAQKEGRTIVFVNEPSGAR